MTGTASGALVAGIDVGSTLTKVALYDGRLVASRIGRTEPRYAEGAMQLFESVLADLGVGVADVAYIVATGYGRRRLDVADKQVTEIACHARGVRELFPGARTIVEVGGQDAKGIKLARDGKVVGFVMNDKCAAGTGRFLDVVSAMLGLTTEALGELGLRARERRPVSTICSVFAEQEVVQRLVDGEALEDVAAGLHDALSSRVCGMVRRLKIEPDVVLTGGATMNRCLAAFITERLGLPVIAPAEPMLTGALGAALFARDALDRGATRGERPGSAASAAPRDLPRRSHPSALAPPLTRRLAPAASLRECIVRETPLAVAGAVRTPVAGVDVGSRYTKAVVIHEARATIAICPSHGDYGGAATRALESALDGAGFGREALCALGKTGVGAARLGAGREFSNVTCLASATSRLTAGTACIVDLGGQALRLVRLDAAGRVKDFSVGGQCAAGSARLLEVVAHVLGVSVSQIGDLGLRSEAAATVSTGCAVFAETELISLLAGGVTPEDLVAGLHATLAEKLRAMTRAAGIDGTCLLTGGGAADVGLVARARAALPRVAVPDEPIAFAALGAAFLAGESERRDA